MAGEDMDVISDCWQRDFSAKLGQGWPARKWTSRTFDDLVANYAEPMDWSGRLVRSYAPPFADGFVQGLVYDPFVTTYERPRASVGRRNETPYRAAVSAPSGLRDELIDELWSISARGFAVLPLPGDHRKFIIWAGKGHASWYDKLATIAHYDVVVVTARHGVGGAEKVAKGIVEATGGNESRSLIVVADVNDVISSQNPETVSLGEMLAAAGLGSETGAQSRAIRLLEVLTVVDPKVVIVINSAIGTLCLKRGLLDGLKAKKFFTLFSRPVDREGVQRGFYLDLPWIDSKVDGYLTDNAIMARDLAAEGIDEGRIAVLPIPAGGHLKYRLPLGGQDILWCSRMDPEKRPDLLLEISRLCPSLRFRVYGLPLLGDPSILESIKAAPNIDFRGGFERFSEIVHTGCAAFLYTSAYDGMPNVVLEAMQVGLPVVASGVGGVPEALAGGRGCALSVDAQPIQYGEALQALIQNVPRRLVCSFRAARFVKRRHSFHNFDRALLRVLNL